jgi:uncharacterized protein (TIGR03435 family)
MATGMRSFCVGQAGCLRRVTSPPYPVGAPVNNRRAGWQAAPQYALLVMAIGAMLVQPGNAQSFEVASVRMAPPVPIGETYNINLGKAEHGMVTLTNTTLSDSLRFAYGITSDAQIAGPDWIRNKELHYVISAKAAPETSREDLLRMLQSLLAERFKLVMHREPREMSYYALTQAKKGTKMEPAKEGAGVAVNRPGHIANPQMSMYTLAVVLSRFELHAPILDMTELNGLFGVQLEWSPAGSGAPGSSPNADVAAGPSLFTAVQEQLGLRLEARKGPVEVLVIDRAEKTPAEN